MMAASTPAVRMPDITGVVKRATMMPSTLLALSTGRSSWPPAHTPISTAGQPHRHHQHRVGDHGELEGVGRPRRQPVLEDVREHAHRQADESVAQEVHLADRPLTHEQLGALRRGGLDRGGRPPQGAHDRDEGEAGDD